MYVPTALISFGSEDKFISMSKVIVSLIRKKLFILGLSFLLCNGVECQTHKQLSYLFESGTEGYQCFRIPAIVTSTQGTVLAFAEGRKKGCSDTGDIDLVMKYSEDHGETWSKLIVIRDDR